MLSSSFLDVAIGIVFVFLLLSLIASTINEIILSFFNMRGRTLLEGIKNLLDDPKAEGLAKEIYNQGQVYGLYKGPFNPGETWKDALPLLGKTEPDLGKCTRSNLPSYIPTTNFVMAFLGALPNAAKTASDSAARQEAEAKTKADNAKADADSHPDDKAKQDALKDAEAAYTKAQETAKNAQEGASKVESALAAAQAPLKTAVSSGPPSAQQIAATPVELVAAFQSLKAVAEALSNNPVTVKVGKPLLAMIATADNDFDKLKTSIADWYNSAMDRASGWYKYNTQTMLFSIGIVLAIALNANTIVIVQQLSKNPTLRESIVAAAATEAAKAKDTPATPPPPDSTDKNGKSPLQNLQDQVKELDELGIPLGWPTRDGETWWKRNNDALQRPGTWVGWLFTAVAVSLGAPFWFDMLNKIMIVRSTVKPGEKSQPGKDKEKK
jgi:hypothetical protein